MTFQGLPDRRGARPRARPCDARTFSPKGVRERHRPLRRGKSTLMNIIGCLTWRTPGTYRLDGIPIEDYSERKAARSRPQSEDRLHFSELQSDRQALRGGERGASARLPRVRPAERAKRVAAALERVGSLQPRQAPADGALRRPAAARGHRPRARNGALAPARRRADRQP